MAQESNYPELSESIASRQLLLTTKIDTNKPKITPTYRDLQQFNDVLQFIEKPTPVLLPFHGSPTGLVLDAFATLSQGVRDRIETIAAEIEAGSREIEIDEKDTAGDGSSLHFALDFFHDLVMERIEFIEIFLDDRHDPNEVFERLNSAGQPLDEADFVRNDVFQRIPADPDLASQIYHHN